MASRGLGTLTLDLAVKTGMFTAGLDKAGRDLDRRAKAMQKSAKAAGVAIGAALVAGATAFGYAIKSAIDQADQLNEISKKIGIPTDVLSGLNYAAKLSGVATEELQAGLVKMIKFQAEAAAGAKKNVKVFSTLGIAIKDSAGNLRDTQAVFSDFAEIFKNLPDGPEKTALALKVFGKAGAELIPLLNEGKSGIRAYADELRALGGEVTPATAAAADEFNDNIDKLKVAFGGLALQVAADLLPALKDLTNEFVSSVKSGDGVSQMAHNIGDAFRFVGGVFSGVGDAIRRTTLDMIGLYEALHGLSQMTLPGWLNAKLTGDRTDHFAQSRLAFDMSSAVGRPAGSTGPSSPGGAGSMGLSGAARLKGPDISGLFEPETKGAKKHREAVDQVAEAYKRMKEQLQESIALYEVTSEVVKTRYEIEHGLLVTDSQAHKDELLALAAERDAQIAKTKATEERHKLMEDEEQQIARHKDSVKDLLDDIAFETSLIGKNNEERERMIALRGLNGQATEAEAAQITTALTALQEQTKANDQLTSAMDEFRGNFEDAVVDVVTGAKSISEAFKSLADSIVAQIARIIAQQLAASLFGAPGTTGGGSSGGWLSSLFKMFLGGGSSSAGANSNDLLDYGLGLSQYAGGGNPPVGQPYIVGENGPELHIDRTPSTIVPAAKFGGGVTIHIHGNATRETAQQIANEARRVMAFSGRSG